MSFLGHQKGSDRQNLTLWCELGWHPHLGYRFNTNEIISKSILHCIEQCFMAWMGLTYLGEPRELV